MLDQDPAFSSSMKYLLVTGIFFASLFYHARLEIIPHF